MRIFQVPVEYTERAWKDGAHNLSEAVEKAKGEITTDQLKMLITRGERALLGVSDEEKVIAWLAVQVQQLPNVRTLYVYSIYAPNGTMPAAFEQLRQYAKAAGCSEIRGACVDSVLRLWERKFKAEKLYSVMRIMVGD